MATQYRTPGVYLQEPDSFPPSIVGVETAVPCFIGYTAKANDRDGRSLLTTPKRIESMAEFVQFFGDRYREKYYLFSPTAQPVAPPNDALANGRRLAELTAAQQSTLAIAGLLAADAATKASAAQTATDAANKAAVTAAASAKTAGAKTATTEQINQAAKDAAAAAAAVDAADAAATLSTQASAAAAAAKANADAADAAAKAPATTPAAAPAATAQSTPPATDPDWGAIALADGSRYQLVEAGRADFNLFNSMRLFYANGGGSCYIISAGTWDGVDNPAISADELLTAIDKSTTFIGPTMLVIPDAVLLQPTDYAKVVSAMLAACWKTGDRMAILDIQGADHARSADEWEVNVDAFRDAVRSGPPEYFRYGAAYFPSLVTSIVSADEIDVSNFDEDQLVPLKAALTKVANATLTGKSLTTVTGYINAIGSTVSNSTPIDLSLPLDKRPMTHKKLTQALVATLPGFDKLVAAIAATQGVLPPSGAIAGAWATNDRVRGVWNAPANTGIATLIKPRLSISEEEQGELNVPVEGLAINAVRTFQGRGSLIWGARTLDSLSNDWRYIQVRRTMIYVEQSVKQALEAMVFKPNTAQTWVTVTSMIESFLHGLWASGGLMGDSADQAYNVHAGLGSTMTPDDVLNGVMRVHITLQMVHPAEFIELTFKQQMLGGA